MSKVIINGQVIMSTADAPRSATTVTPSFSTHRLVDGNWVPKGSAPAAVVAPKATIGFVQPLPPTPTSTTQVFLGSRKEYLRAIEIAAGKVLLAGTNQKAIDAIRRGRLGGRKDNMGDLHTLLREYSA